ncbi:MAG: hypothetical protein KBB88_03500 [Candidatus Pacebacteria bacterium]|jgi:hypothetical protein|nr:hypothetical protein [Candidatus Paceibacterota bacterium]
MDTEQSYTEKVLTSITSIVPVALSKDDIILKNSILTLKTNPAIKMAILLKKEMIIETLLKNGITVSSIR